ncbi:MAG: DUF1801 domain-containing protein [Anaerolineales bacterium]|nr:DUF1801 domain-containing protein [Anaerolineales bacterium]
MGKSDPSRHAPEEIDDYLAALPDDVRKSLERMRQIIRATAPECTERVSYKIPIFRWGKDLVGISAQKNHCAFHTMSPKLVKSMKAELENVKVSGATIHFTAHDPLPEDLVEDIVRRRIGEITAG